jgi:hypothetical protein
MQTYNLLKKSSKKETKILQDIIITLYNLISSLSTSQNIMIFSYESSYKNRPIIIIIIIIT